ncbi:MAG: single-stranded-DNA-specific exonuclease RecJ [Solirubrobacteraceae bacterium]
MLPRLEIPAYDFAAAQRLERELGVSHVLAQVLVRRGYAEPACARAFLAADETHDSNRFDGIEEAVATILRHVDRRSRIVVHGDYDVDGVCSTAILVRVLRSLGGVVGWFIPSRVDDGYGLSVGTVTRLAANGTALLVTVDCAITAVEEVAAARAVGMEVVVTDHHAPRADGALPDAPIVHPALGGYPCPELCAAGVAHKLAAALLSAAGRDPAGADEDLDLVGLATIADVVVLRGENRRLARAGLRALAATPKPGLRALMRVARVDPSGLDARAVGFRLAPRINAAGRLYRADAGVELALAEDRERAEAIAAELDAANAERRAVEERTLFEAQRLAREADERWAERAGAGDAGKAQPSGPYAYVLAGEGWHPGVVGIVASRIAERHHRPTVLVALDGARGTGSGRSIPGFDLLAGLRAAGEHLARYGGHSAAAGMEVARDRLDAFRTAFEAHAHAALSPEDLIPVERVDAVVTGDALGAGLAEELELLEPCGAGNPSPTLLVPAATFADPRQMGEGRHVRFTLHAGGIRSRALCFGSARLPVEEGAPTDATVRLELSEYRGVIEPRLVLGTARPCTPPPIQIVGQPQDYLAAVLEELDAPLESGAARGVDAPLGGRPAGGGDALLGAEAGGRRSLVDRCGAGVAGVVSDLVASGERVLVVCACVSRRRGGLAERLGGFDLCSYEALARRPELAVPARHVVLLDPPTAPSPPDLPGAGYTHLAWGPDELGFARAMHEHSYALRSEVASLYRALRSAGGVRGRTLAATLCGDGTHPRSAAHAGRLLRILDELELVNVDRSLGAAAVPEARRTALDRSTAFRFYTRRYEDGLRCLDESTARAA